MAYNRFIKHGNPQRFIEPRINKAGKTYYYQFKPFNKKGKTGIVSASLYEEQELSIKKGLSNFAFKTRGERDDGKNILLYPTKKGTVGYNRRERRFARKWEIEQQILQDAAKMLSIDYDDLAWAIVDPKKNPFSPVGQKEDWQQYENFRVADGRKAFEDIIKRDEVSDFDASDFEQSLENTFLSSYHDPDSPDSFSNPTVQTSEEADDYMRRWAEQFEEYEGLEQFYNHCVALVYGSEIKTHQQVGIAYSIGEIFREKNWSVIKRMYETWVNEGDIGLMAELYQFYKTDK